ncbi:MAG: hypothetical protein ACO3CN_00405, partial [Candidatus Nanopelagicales bacterium]
MAAGSLDITIEQGATWNLVLTWKINGSAVNLTSYTGRLQARVDVRALICWWVSWKQAEPRPK